MIRRVIEGLRDDRGLTVIELVIASALSLVILLSVFGLIDSGTRNERGTQARQEALLDLRESMTRASKDIRQATDVNTSSTSASLDIQTLVGGTPTRMIYDVTGTDFRRTLCTNFDFTATCGGTAMAMANNVTTVGPFCYDPPDCVATAPSAALTAVRITLAGTPEVISTEPITLATDIQLRNM